MDVELLMNLEKASQQSREIEEKLKVVEQQVAELESFRVSLDALKNSDEKEILASLGRGVFVKSDIKDEKFFVDVGSGILVRKDAEESRRIVSEQIDKLNEMRIQLIAENESIGNELKLLAEKVK